VRRPTLTVGSALATAFAVACGAGCTLLVSFDDLGDAGCIDDAACITVPLSDADALAGGHDATMGSSHHASTGRDGSRPRDSAMSMTIDVGDCAQLGEGAPCAKPATCQMSATCKMGVCTTNPLPDGTGCGTAPDACHDAPVCASGACAPAAAAADGTVCAAAPDVCHKSRVCSAGACAAAADEPDTTACGVAPDACHDAPLCASGVCGAAKVLAESTNWNTKDGNARCCGGKPVETTTTTNCGVCGWTCGSGQGCAVLDGEYLCTGCTADSECLSDCCSLSPTPNHCSPGNCAGGCQSPDICTGGSHCVAGASVDYCTY